MKNKNASKIFYSLFDIISFLILIFLMQNLNRNDPGEFIFLFAYESQFILIAFFLLLIILYPIQRIIINKNINIPIKYKVPENKELLNFLYIIIGIVALFFISYLILLFLNQLSIEFMLSYTKNSGYNFKSLEILSQNTVFLDLSDEFEDILKININFLVIYFIAKHFILFLIQTTFDQNFKTDKSLIFKHFYMVSVSAIMSPISMFIAMMFLVICTSILKGNTWIPLVSMAIFQLIFRFSTNKISSAIKKI